MNTTEAKDIIQWDVRTWSKALNYWKENTNWDRVNKALELGAREGGLSLWLSQNNVSTICSDYTETEQRATPLHSRFDSAEKISYENIDATNIPYENHFDLIVFKSIVGGIGREDNIDIQQKVFDEIYKALKPGGTLLFAENLTATKLHQKLRARHNKWGSYWRYITLNELNSFLEAFSSYQIKTTGLLATLGRNEKQKDILARIDEICLNHITPANWHYVGYGIATK